MSRPKKVQVARKCLFCERGNLSKEHIWPAWARSLLPDSDHYEIHRGYGAGLMAVERKSTGSIKDTKVRAPCKTCNETWMHDIEDEVRPVLTPMIEGKPIALGGKEQRILAEWIALKVMVLEWEKPEQAVVRQEERAAFRRDRTIPPGMTLLIARCGVPGYESLSFREAMKLGVFPMRMDDPMTVQATTLCIGDLVTHGFVVNNDMNADELAAVDPEIHRLHPRQFALIDWPKFGEA